MCASSDVRDIPHSRNTSGGRLEWRRAFGGRLRCDCHKMPYEASNQNCPAYVSKAVCGFQAIERHGQPEIEIWQLTVPVDAGKFTGLCHQVSAPHE